PHGDGDPQTDMVLAWELLYRLEPELYDRLASAERLHPEVLGWRPRGVDRIAEVGAGSGRLTLELLERGREVVAVEPAMPLRQLLRRKLTTADHGNRARVIHVFFDLGNRLLLEQRPDLRILVEPVADFQARCDFREALREALVDARLHEDA